MLLRADEAAEPCKLSGKEQEKVRVAEKIAPPQSPRLAEQSKRPLQSIPLHPTRGLGLYTRDEIEGSADGKYGNPQDSIVITGP